MSSPEQQKLPRMSLIDVPEEVLQRVVTLVAAQDEAVRESGVPLADEPPPSTSTHAGSGRAMLPNGKWSFWYGHGVSALSLVNKALRLLALPFLCQVRSPVSSLYLAR